MTAAAPDAVLLSVAARTFQSSSHSPVRAKAVEVCAAVIGSEAAMMSVKETEELVRVAVAAIQDAGAEVRKVALEQLVPEVRRRFPLLEERIVQRLTTAGKRTIGRVKDTRSSSRKIGYI